jgi:hypothetical protein
MSDLLAQIRTLVRRGEVVISRHGFRELAADDIALGDVLAGIDDALRIEDYPDTGRGPSLLVLTRDSERRPLHVVWGLHIGKSEPAVLVTAYRPDPARWLSDWTTRRKP